MQPNAGGVDGAPIIRTTDCDHEASVLARTATLEEQPEEVEEVVIELEEKSSQDKLVWDSKAGSTVDVGILGSVIETYLKTSTEEDSECSTSKKSTYKSQPLLGSRLNAKWRPQAATKYIVIIDDTDDEDSDFEEIEKTEDGVLTPYSPFWKPVVFPDLYTIVTSIVNCFVYDYTP